MAAKGQPQTPHPQDIGGKAVNITDEMIAAAVKAYHHGAHQFSDRANMDAALRAALALQALDAGQPVATEDEFTCLTCNGQLYARVDERKADGSFGPGPLVRCVNCKAVYRHPSTSVPADKAEPGTLSKAQKAVRDRIYDALAKEGGGTWATYVMIDVEELCALYRAAPASSVEALRENEPPQPVVNALNEHFERIGVTTKVPSVLAYDVWNIMARSLANKEG
jgi:hypothetical protein